jgi:hypothetical protein
MVSKDELVNAVKAALEGVSKGDESTTLILTASSEETELEIVIPVMFEVLLKHSGVGQMVCGENRRATAALVDRLEDPKRLVYFVDIALLGRVDTITLVKRTGITCSMLKSGLTQSKR